MAVAPKIADFGIVNIDTTPIRVKANPGFAGVAVIVPGQNQALHTYYSLSDVVNDFAPTTYTYKAASNYFNNPNATTFQAITYPTSGNSVSLSATSNNDHSHGAEVEHPDGSATPQGHQNPTTSNGNGSNDPAVKALTKYYTCGAEFFVFEVTSKSDQQTAIDLSNLVEGQSQNVLFLDQPTSGIATDKDFAWYDNSVKTNLSTELFSLPFSGDPSDYQFVSAVLSQYAGQSPASNLELTNNIPNLQPQDYYNFTDQDFDVYKKAGVITYCYRNDVPMLSSGNSASGYQVSNLITRDYLNDQIKVGITNMLINAHNSGSDIHYDQPGVNQIIGEMNLVLSSAAKAGYIKNPNVRNIDVNKIPDSIKEEGQLNGLAYSWEPNNNVSHIQFHQSIVLPQLTNA